MTSNPRFCGSYFTTASFTNFCGINFGHVCIHGVIFGGGGSGRWAASSHFPVLARQPWVIRGFQFLFNCLRTADCAVLRVPSPGNFECPQTWVTETPPFRVIGRPFKREIRVPAAPRACEKAAPGNWQGLRDVNLSTGRCIRGWVFFAFPGLGLARVPKARDGAAALFPNQVKLSSHQTGSLTPPLPGSRWGFSP